MKEVIPKGKVQAYRKAITEVKEHIEKLPGAYDMEGADKMNPVKHTFGDGFYMRETTVPANQVVVTKIHKKENPLFMLKGKCVIITEEGTVDHIAPSYTVTKPGTQRLIKTIEECTWVTVHVTEAKNLKDVEEDVIAKNFDDPLVTLDINENKKLK